VITERDLSKIKYFGNWFMNRLYVNSSVWQYAFLTGGVKEK
jgi:hypothetical protein